MTEPARPPDTSHSRGLFVGRRAELAIFSGASDRVSQRGSRVMLIEGPAGIGKTEVLRQFLRSRHDLRVLWADGDDADRPGSFALIGRLLGSIGVRPLRTRTVGMSALEQPVEVGRRMTQALTGVVRQSPIVLVIDHVHRVDRDSLRALLFALRRLSTHPVLTILVRRSDEVDLPEGLVRLAENDRTGLIVPIGPLQPVEVQELALGVGLRGLTMQAARRMSVHALGNPRHVIALSTELPVEVWDREALPPAPQMISYAVGHRLAACRDEVRRLVEAASVLGRQSDLRSAGLLAAVSEPLIAWEEACSAGLLATPLPGSPWCVSFPDSLVRAAVYWQLGPSQRLRLQRAATGLTDDQGVRLRRRDLLHADSNG